MHQDVHCILFRLWKQIQMQRNFVRLFAQKTIIEKWLYVCTTMRCNLRLGGTCDEDLSTLTLFKHKFNKLLMWYSRNFYVSPFFTPQQLRCFTVPLFWFINPFHLCVSISIHHDYPLMITFCIQIAMDFTSCFGKYFLWGRSRHIIT